MHSIFFLVACLMAAAMAAPTLLNDLYKYSDELGEFYGKVSKHIEDATKNSGLSTACDTSKIALPSSASGLPSPTDAKPLYVAVGRGTQNYTCATSDSNSKPVNIGALANLYNATCIAANYPDIIDNLPNIAYKIPLSADISASFPPANIDLLGHHFFTGSVPTFNLDTTPMQQYGIAFTKKGGSMDAPSGAIQGDNGAVAWLYLTTTNGTVGNFKSVYRVDTAGGAAPKTCENMPSSFEVQYAANYFFYENE